MQPFVTKLGIVVHHHGPECHAEKMGCYHQGQGHSVGLYNQNMIMIIKYLLYLLLVLNQ